MKNKGFTLVEILVVIVIVGLLMIIVVPTTIKYISSGKKSYYHSLEKEAKVAGMDYMETYRGLLPRNIGHVSVVELDELVENKFIDEVVDEKGNACTGQVAVEKVKTGSYEYHSCIKCGTYYESNDTECEYNELNNHYADSERYSVEVAPGPYSVNQGEEFIAPLGKVYYDGELIKEDLEGKPKKLNTNIIGTYEIIYFYHGASAKITVEVKDGNAPGKVQVVLKQNSKSGKSYKGDWFSGDIYVSYKATDYVKDGISGSGIDHYEVSATGVEGSYHKISDNDGTDYKALSVNEEVLQREGYYDRYVIAVDKAGNASNPIKYSVKIDKTEPECTWEGETTDWQPKLSDYPTQEARDNFSRTFKATCHDGVSDCTTTTSSKSWTIKDSFKTKELKYTMKDLAGNTKVCKKDVQVYIDKTKPNISGSDIPLGTQDYAFTSNVTTNDKLNGVELSGVKSVVCDPATSRKTGMYDVTCTVTDNMGLTNSVAFKAKHQFTVSGATESNGSLCGTYTAECNCYYKEENCRQQCDGRECSCCDLCDDPSGGGSHSGNSFCWDCYATSNKCYCTDWNSCHEVCDSRRVCSSCTYNHSCTVYTCPSGTHHADGSQKSTTDNVCYY